MKPKHISISSSDSTGESQAPREPAPEPVILIIADISGYTRYMTANVKSLAHSQLIITELIVAIIKQVELPLEVAKLEGDAVFLYCRKQNSSQPWPETRKIIGEKLFAFFEIFRRKVAELSRSTTCHCSACAHIERLRLKLIVHSGEALFHRVLQFLELAGVDVIIVHRLLKNSVTSDQYLLMTAAAREDVPFPVDVPLVRASESYDDLGSIDTLVYFPDTESAPGQIDDESAPVPLLGERAGQPPYSYATRFHQSWKLFCKLWFSPLAAWPGSQQQSFRHVTSSTSAASCFAFAAVTLLFTPFFVPVGTLMALLHALKQPARPHRHDAAPPSTREGSDGKSS